MKLERLAAMIGGGWSAYVFESTRRNSLFSEVVLSRKNRRSRGHLPPLDEVSEHPEDCWRLNGLRRRALSHAWPNHFLAVIHIYSSRGIDT